MVLHVGLRVCHHGQYGRSEEVIYLLTLLASQIHTILQYASIYLPNAPAFKCN